MNDTHTHTKQRPVNYQVHQSTVTRPILLRLPVYDYAHHHYLLTTNDVMNTATRLNITINRHTRERERERGREGREV